MGVIKSPLLDAGDVIKIHPIDVRVAATSTVAAKSSNANSPSATDIKRAESTPSARDAASIADIESARKNAVEQGRREGYEKGLEEGKLAAKKQEAQALQSLADAANVLRASAEAQINDVEPFAVKLAYAAVLRLLGQAMAQDTVIIQVVKDLLAEQDFGRRIKVRLRPDHVELVKRATQDWELLSDAVNISWVADPSIKVGGCLIETDAGLVDGKLETQLRYLLDQFLKTFKSA